MARIKTSGETKTGVVMAENKIFVLQEKGGCGKSSTIKNIFFLLIEKYHNTMKINSFKIHPSSNDITAQIVIDGLLIGIESQGDPNSTLKLSLNAFAKSNCNIIFCPARTSGMTIKWINSYNQKYEIKFHNQIIVESSNSQQNKSNLAVAKKLIKNAGL